MSDMFGINCFRPFRANVLVLHSNRALPCFAAIAPLGHFEVQDNSLINHIITGNAPDVRLFTL